MLITKKIKGLSLILTAILIFSAVAPVFAESNGTTWTAKFWIGKAYYEVNGQRQTMDVAPYAKYGRTLLPIRYAANAVGVPDEDVKWDQATRKVTIKKGADTVIFTIGSKNMEKNGQTTVMDVTPEVLNGRTMLPIRYVGEALDANVDWAPETQMVVITIGEDGETQPPVQPPVQPPTDGTVVSIPIDMTAAWNGTLLPKPGTQTGADEWGLEPKAKSIECKVGSRYATVTGLDGSQYTLDLGTEVVVVGTAKDINWLKSTFPRVYNSNNAIIDETIEDKYGKISACYIPFIPVAKAFGVPDANIVWDGTHLAVFGYYGRKENYRVLTAGSREVVAKTVGNNPEVGTGNLNFPLYVRGGVPMLGVDSVNDFWAMLFAGPAGPNLINTAIQDGGGFDFVNGETGWTVR